MYLDEVGNPDLKSSDNPNHRFLSLTGANIELGHVESVIHPQLEALKRKYFHSHPDDPVILHRRDIVNKRGRFNPLKNPATQASFDAELLGLLHEWQFTVVSVCLDKKKHRDQYRVWRYDPYHYCLAVRVERFVFFLVRDPNRCTTPREVFSTRRANSRFWEKSTLGDKGSLSTPPMAQSHPPPVTRIDLSIARFSRLLKKNCNGLSNRNLEMGKPRCVSVPR